MKVAGFTSGEGRNLLAVGTHRPGGAELALVITDDLEAAALPPSRDLGASTEVVDPDELAGTDELAVAFEDHGIDLVLLDGYEPSLPPDLEEWPTVLTAVPTLLPAFEDADDPVAAAVEARVAVTGATVHVVDPGTGADPDAESEGSAGEGGAGPSRRILAQEPVFVGEGSVEAVRERVADATTTASLRAVRELAGGDGEAVTGDEGDDRFPAAWLTTADRVSRLRYGENPHQDAALYGSPTTEPSVVDAVQHNEGTKAMSYNNYNDADAALSLVREFDRPAASVIKHTNPAGCATAPTVAEAYDRALSTDPMSAFGGIVALNRECDRQTAEAITESFKEVVVAPTYTEGGLETLREEENLRVLSVGTFPDPGDRTPTVVETDLMGGRLLQERDDARPGPGDLEVVTEREPTDEEVESLLFAWLTVKHVKSNAIVFATGTETVGIGAGQVSRVDAVELAAKKAREDAEGKSAEGAVMASDAFFPFPDGVEAAADAGVEAVIQPGGSVNDDDVIAAADDRGMAMVFTGRRAFRHD
ncbi:phosphoribosylglycinamide formyltransferase [Halobacteriales archaeon QS_8_69_26]|nr:MAG: phosphoribosylglycinamide formyltransferase [Halobacteriales archaeon QS_8_69_26]